MMKANIDCLGKWPVDGKKSREEKRLVAVREQDHLPLVHGQQQHVLMSMIVSNDVLNVGIITIPVGGYSEMECHRGDETLYALHGEVTIRTMNPGEKERRENASFMSQQVRESEKMLIPEGIRHQYLNFTEEVIKVFFAVAPGL
ncbi:MAG: hypothetical protein JSV89_22005 [Spirochaetaceae bacterium]|nr:MAG: hypothetical protein JSV89_22005 [Spirochaetaceae bacterium]